MTRQSPACERNRSGATRYSFELVCNRFLNCLSFTSILQFRSLVTIVVVHKYPHLLKYFYLKLKVALMVNILDLKDENLFASHFCELGRNCTC